MSRLRLALAAVAAVYAAGYLAAVVRSELAYRRFRQRVSAAEPAAGDLRTLNLERHR